MKPWSLVQVNRWMGHSALNALEEAYQGALTIQAIEEQHFGGSPIRVKPDLGKSVTDYFRTQLDRQLLRVRSSLLRFRLVSFWVNRQALAPAQVSGTPAQFDFISAEAAVLDKLAFIESVVGKYRQLDELWGDLPPEVSQIQIGRTQPVDPVGQTQIVTTEVEQIQLAPNRAVPGETKPIKTLVTRVKSVKSKPPEVMALFGGAGKIGKEFSPQYEQEVIQDLRARRTQNRLAVRWLIMLVLVPLLVQTVTKHVLLGPVFGSYFDRNPTKVELSQEVEEKFLQEFKDYREELEVKRLLAKAMIQEEKKRQPSKDSPEAEEAMATAIFGEIPAEMLQDMLSMQPGRFSSLISSSSWTEVEAELEEKALEEKAVELWREARQKQLDGLRNVIADTAALIAFLGLLVAGRNQVTAIQGFSNRAFLGLNDPTKVFLFILITDMFVGFHSAEGWDVILASLAHHFGLPENQAAIKSFIATVPVFIDACIKFWIFTYLTRYSPSTSAIYERMNT
jgi:hypothetical protein